MKRKRKHYTTGLEGLTKHEALCFWVLGELPQNILVKMNPRFDPTEFGWEVPEELESDGTPAADEESAESEAPAATGSDGTPAFPDGPLTLADRAFWVIAFCWLASMGCAYGAVCWLSHPGGLLYALLDSVAYGTEGLLAICRLLSMWVAFFASYFWWYRAPYRSVPCTVIAAALGFVIIVIALTGLLGYMQAVRFTTVL